ncbi:MAG: hypothetical protein R2731_13725 [Nocardioides sp.]
MHASRSTLLATALAGAGLLLAAPAAHADGGFDVTSTSSYTLEAKQEDVRATMTITVRNDRPSVRTGNYIQYYYLPALSVPIPADAQQVQATSNGAALSVTRAGTKDPSTSLATVRFPSNLLYGQTRTVTISFVLEGEKPRSKDQTRVGPGHATFAVFGPGDPGQNTVQVVLPRSMTFDATTDTFTRKDTGGTVTYTATTQAGGAAGGDSSSSGFWAVVSARNLAVAKSEKVSIGGQRITVQAYRDDPRWLRFDTSRMGRGLPVLEKLVGTPWPGGLTTVREDHSVNVRGYDGWFDTGADEIVIGESLDQEALFHELAHAWANHHTLGERWLSEGIAQQLAGRATAEVGAKPRPLKEVSPTGGKALALNTWTVDQGGRAQPADAYGYPASYQVVKTLLDGCADGTQSSVLAAAVAGSSAYDAPGDNQLGGTVSNWQRFLDLVQIRGLNDQAPATFDRWVLTPPQRGWLKERSRALAEYRKVDAANGDFAPPLGLRQAMSDWSFAAAREDLTEIEGLGAAAVQVQQAAERFDMEVPEQVAALYENATDYADLPAVLPKAATAVGAVGAADRAAETSRNPLAALGARILQVDAKTAAADRLLADADLDAATAAARQTTAAARWTTWLGAGVVLGGLLVLAGLTLLGRALLRRRARRRLERAARVRNPEAEADGTGAAEPAPVASEAAGAEAGAVPGAFAPGPPSAGPPPADT